MAKQASQEEQDEARHYLEEAIYKDGEGGPTQSELALREKLGLKDPMRKSYHESIGKYMWTPKPLDFSHWWARGAFTYSMGTSESQVRAYHRQGETVVTHNGTERHKLDVRGWY